MDGKIFDFDRKQTAQVSSVVWLIKKFVFPRHYAKLFSKNVPKVRNVLVENNKIKYVSSLSPKRETDRL